MYRVLTIAAVGLMLVACAYQAPVGVSPNLNVYSSYGDKLPGTFALFVSSDGFVQDVKPTGLSCSYHHFPLDVQAQFKESVVKTVQQLVENVEVVDQPLSGSELAASGKRGMIVVRADTMVARIQFIPGFWTATGDANVDLSANMTVDTQGGRLLGTTAEGTGNATGEAGQLCGGGANVIGQATEKAMKQLLGQLGERLSNSPRLRGTAYEASPPPLGPDAAPAAPPRRASHCVRVVTDPSQTQC